MGIIISLLPLLQKIFLQAALKASSQAAEHTACTRDQYKMDHSTDGAVWAACENMVFTGGAPSQPPV